MLQAMIILATLIVWMGLLFFCIECFFEDMKMLGLACALALFVSLSWVMAQMIEYEKESPCAQYETQHQYDQRQY